MKPLPRMELDLEPEERSKTGIIVAVVCWLVVVSIIALAAKKWIIPMFKQKERDKITQQTSSRDKYKQEVKIAADAFSGYGILRSAEMGNLLKAQGIRLTIIDDKADYKDRIKKLQDGDIQMAVFTIDSLVKAGNELGDFPASIVYVIDETKGADAMVARTNTITSLADLNNKDTRIVFTPDSPSEFLTRIVIASFNLPNFPQKWAITANGAEEVLKQLQNDAPRERRAYVLWEPYVSRARQLLGVQVLVDSSKLKGYIVDVLVCQREFLISNYGAAKAVVETYARSAYACSSASGRMTELVADDAKATGSGSLDKSLAEQLVKTIQWKNTIENYAHFGLVPRQEAQGLEHLDDMISKITDILIKTGVMKDDPLGGRPNTLFCDRILKDMKDEGFHPGRDVNLLTDPALGLSGAEQIRGEKESGPLSEEQWNALMPVGELRVDPISFGRGAANISQAADRELAKLARALQSWPQYYLFVTGQARPEGDVDANKQLAQSRASAVVQILTVNNISVDRIKVRSAVATVGGGDAQTVVFTVSQQPY